MVLASMVFVVAIAVARIVLFGWAPVSADDARYLYVGLSVLEGEGPRMESGQMYVARSPVYGTILGLPAAALGVEPFDGARAVALALTVLALCLCVLMGAALSGVPGAIGVAVTLAATPFVWYVVPTMRVDPVQAGGLLATILLLWRPTARRWALAGAVFGLTVLVKETIAPAVLLPIAWWGMVERGRWLQLATTFVLAALLVTGWWWLFVWQQAGVLFPMNAIETAAGRDVPNPLELGPAVLVLAVVFATAWIAVIVRRRHEPGVQMVGLAAAAAIPAAAIAFRQELNERQYTVLVVLCIVVTGAVIGPLAAHALAAMRGASSGTGLRHRRMIAGLAGVALVGLSLAAVAGGQALATRPAQTTAAARVADHLRANLPAGATILASFGIRSELAVELRGRAQVDGLPTRQVMSGDDPADYVWMALRGRDIYGIPRAQWRLRLSEGRRAFVVIEGPGSLAPLELVPAFRSGAFGARLEPSFEIDDGRGRAYAFRVHPEAPLLDVALHATAEGLATWLRLAGPDAPGRLVAAEPLVFGSADAREALAMGLDGVGCLAPADPAYRGAARRLLAAGDPTCRPP